MKKEDIVFKLKKSYHISHNAKYICCLGKNVNIYDATSGEATGSIKSIKYLSFSRFLSEEKLIVKTGEGIYYICDLENKEIVKKIHSPRNAHPTTSEFAITPDKKYIVDFVEVSGKAKLMFVQIETGEKVLYDFADARRCRLFYDDSKKMFYIAAFKVTDFKEGFWDFYTMECSPPTFTLEKIEIGKIGEPYDINLNTGDVVSLKNIIKSSILYSTCEIIIYNMYTKKKESFVCENCGVTHELKFSSDGKYLVLVQSERVSVFDVSKKELIKSFELDYACFADFTDDGKLFVGTWEKGYLLNVSQEG